jgi:hypothetical protein
MQKTVVERENDHKFGNVVVVEIKTITTIEKSGEITETSDSRYFIVDGRELENKTYNECRHYRYFKDDVDIHSFEPWFMTFWEAIDKITISPEDIIRDGKVNEDRLYECSHNNHLTYKFGEKEPITNYLYDWISYKDYKKEKLLGQFKQDPRVIILDENYYIPHSGYFAEIKYLLSQDDFDAFRKKSYHKYPDFTYDGVDKVLLICEPECDFLHIQQFRKKRD